MELLIHSDTFNVLFNRNLAASYFEQKVDTLSQFKACKLIAEQGQANVQISLGSMYENGDGEVLKWLH